MKYPYGIYEGSIAHTPLAQASACAVLQSTATSVLTFCRHTPSPFVSRLADEWIHPSNRGDLSHYPSPLTLSVGGGDAAPWL